MRLALILMVLLLPATLGAEPVELSAFIQSLRDREGFDASWSPDPKTGVWTETK